MHELPWHLWRDGILAFAPPLHARQICRAFELHSRPHLYWTAPPSAHFESQRQRVHCVQRLLYKNPTYACIGGDHCERFLFHYVCTKLEEMHGSAAAHLKRLTIINSRDVFRIVALLLRCTSLTSLKWTWIDDDDEIPWDTLRPTLERIRHFTSSIVDPIRFMPNLRRLHILGDIDEPCLHELRALRNNLRQDNQIKTILFGNETDYRVDTRHYARAGRMISQITIKCKSLRYMRVTGMAVAIDLVRREPKRTTPLRLEVVTRVIVTM